MPFLRITRDKRGYEYFSLVQPLPLRRGRARQRLLYWFRTPPDIKVGRPPFDEATMRTLEAQYPDITFDWDALRKTPLPPPSSEPWRERRRLERLAKQSRAEDERAEAAQADEPPAVDSEPDVASDPVSDQDSIVADVGVEAIVLEQVIQFTEEPHTELAEVVALAVLPATIPSAGVGDPPVRRRRRRRRGRRTVPPAADGSSLAPQQGDSDGTDAEADDGEAGGDDEIDNETES